MELIMHTIDVSIMHTSGAADTSRGHGGLKRL